MNTKNKIKYKNGHKIIIEFNRNKINYKFVSEVNIPMLAGIVPLTPEL